MGDVSEKRVSFGMCKGMMCQESICQEIMIMCQESMCH